MIAFLAFAFKRALEGLRRNAAMSFAAVATMVLMLALLSGLVIVYTGMEATLQYVQQEVQVVAWLKDSATADQVAAIEKTLGEMPQVTQWKYLSKDDALADFLKHHPEDTDEFRTLAKNPLPASLQINLRDPSDYLDVAAYLHNQPPVDEVLNIQESVNDMVTIINVLRIGGLVILLGVGLIVLFIIVNTIRLAVVSRADEIEIMRLVGASDAFIRWPFVLEGGIVGLSGALITIGLLWLLSGPITAFMSDFFQVLPVAASATVGRDISLLVLGTGVGIGVLGSYLSVRSYLAR